MTELTQEVRDRLIYAFGHMVAGRNPNDPHADASDELARDTIIDLFDLDPETVTEDNEAMLAIGVMLAVAEHVAERYTYTPEGDTT